MYLRSSSSLGYDTLGCSTSPMLCRPLVKSSERVGTVLRTCKPLEQSRSGLTYFKAI